MSLQLSHSRIIKPATARSTESLPPAPSIIRAGDHSFAFTRALEYEEGLGDDPDNPEPDPDAERDMAVMRRMWLVLHKHYPGHMWGTICQHSQGICGITIAALTNYTYVLHLQNVLARGGDQLIMRSGGEFLERYRIPRAGFDVASWLQAVNSVPLFGRTAPPE